MAKKAKAVSYQPTKYQGRERKEQIVAELSEKTDKAKAFVFTNYQGLSHQQIEDLKKGVKNVGAEYVITKNSLILRALANKGISDEDKSHFENPTATLFIYEDVVDPLKELAKSIKTMELPSIKFGIIDGKPVSGQDVITISKLPPLPVLQAQVLGQMMAPIQGLHRALNWNIQSLVMTLNQIAQQKQS